jgi:hypothetical protein
MSYRVTMSRVCVAWALLCAPAFAQQQPLDVTWADGGLTVHVSEAPLADVIQKVSQLTGLEVVGLEKLSGSVSVDFANLPPEPALVKILTNVNYVVQEVAGADANAPHHLVLRVHSMIEGSQRAPVLTGPIRVPALDALFTDEMHDLADEKEVEAEDDDPDAFEDARREKLEAARLASEGAFEPNADVKQLLKLVENLYNDEIRLEALKALGTRSIEVSRRPAIKALGDEVWEIRLTAVEILGKDKDPQTLATMGRLLEKSEDIDERIGALRVLALRAVPESAPYLRAVLKDEDPVIRAAADQILAELDRREQAKKQNAR